MEFSHIPVLLHEVVAGLNIKRAGIYVDCTLGGGGHAAAISRELGPQGMLVGIDRDQKALDAAGSRLQGEGAHFTLVKGNFRFLPDILGRLSISRVDGIVADLGVSSFQIENPERGFSYQKGAPLDMRMDPDLKTTAAEIVNQHSEEELAKIIFEYGEEKWAKRIASFIVERRDQTPILTTDRLVEIIKQAVPARARRTGPHPARRTFQALRIAVNDELGSLKDLMQGMIDCCAAGGRMCVISFHSLEDRLVKESFAEYARGCVCPPDLPQCACGRVAKVKVITRRPIQPSEEEVSKNPRARSAKLRIAERTADEF